MEPININSYQNQLAIIESDITKVERYIENPIITGVPNPYGMGIKITIDEPETIKKINEVALLALRDVNKEHVVKAFGLLERLKIIVIKCSIYPNDILKRMDEIQLSRLKETNDLIKQTLQKEEKDIFNFFCYMRSIIAGQSNSGRNYYLPGNHNTLAMQIERKYSLHITLMPKSEHIALYTTIELKNLDLNSKKELFKIILTYPIKQKLYGAISYCEPKDILIYYTDVPLSKEDDQNLNHYYKIYNQFVCHLMDKLIAIDPCLSEYSEELEPKEQPAKEVAFEELSAFLINNQLDYPNKKSDLQPEKIYANFLADVSIIKDQESSQFRFEISKCKKTEENDYMITDRNHSNEQFELRLCTSTQIVIISFELATFDQELNLEQYGKLLDLHVLGFRGRARLKLEEKNDKMIIKLESFKKMDKNFDFVTFLADTRKMMQEDREKLRNL